MDEKNGRGTAEEQEVAGVQHRPRVNQRRHEPVSGSSHHSGTDPADPGDETDSAAAGDATEPAARDATEPAARDEQRSAAGAQDADGAPGKAVRDMMGGPPPQGDVPDAPATQIAATDEDRKGTRVAHVANAVPGKPDGEVDTRGGYTGS